MIALISFGILCVLIASPVAQEKGKPMSPDLSTIASGKGWTVVGRTATQVVEDGRRAVKLDQRTGIGVVWLDGSDFDTGIIEVDIKGEDVLQRSFVGVTFHGTSNEEYDAVYFRPFNFRSEDPERKIHAVQYISHPDWTWQRLRSEKHNVYEKGVNPVPDPNGWFHARVVVAKPQVSVFVNDAREPSLVVQELSDRRKGRVGLWVGEGSGGTFANLKIERR